MKDNRSNSFWDGGHENYLYSLKKQEQEKLEELHLKLERANSHQSSESIRQEIQTVKEKFKKLAADAGDCLY